MTVNPIGNLLTYGGYVASTAGASAVKAAAEISSVLTGAINDKSLSQDQKNSIAADAAGEKSNPVVYDYRFMPSVPLAKSQDTEKAYNETQKTPKKEDNKKSFSEYLEQQDTEEEQQVRESTGKGYYIVFNDSAATPPEKKTQFTPQELWNERISNTYHLVRFKKNGTLVNLTA